MKTTLTLKTNIIGILFTLLLLTTATAQVGINTTTPSAGSLLDVSSTDKGMLVPRVDIADLNTIAPITGGSTESLLVYNTNTTTGKGFYYWNGSIWINLNSDDWKLAGNLGTSPGTGAGQNYVGTADSQVLVLATNATEALTLSTTQRLLANNNGTNGAPTYSFNSDTNIGMWRSNSDRLNFSAGGREFIELYEGADDELRINDTGQDINFRIETVGNANALFVDGANDNIGLGTGTPNTSSQLELADTDRGILINRVALSATTNASPVTSPATGLLVYNTVTASSGSTEVLPGFYYWDGSLWIAMGGTNGRDWSLLGNAGTNPSNNFLGTTDNTTLIFRTNNSETMRLVNDGRVTINETNPFVGDRFTVTGETDEYAINAYASGTGAGVYSYQTGSGDAMQAINVGSGLGIFAYGANTHGVYGTSPYTGGAFLTGGVIGWGSGNNNSNGVLAVADKVVSSQSNMGIRAVSGSTTSISSTQVMNVGINTNATDLSLYALTEGPITSLGILEAARFQTNYTGNAITPDARDPRAQLAGYTNASQQGNNNMYYGGYFYSGGSNSNSSWAYAGARYGNTNYKIIGNGNVSTIVDGINKSDTKKIMFAPEAPEVLFEDYGIGTLVNGSIHISIDPIFANNITVDQAHPLKVFIQLEGDCNGVYVTDKANTGFTVKELQNGNSNVSFSWHIVANRKNSQGRSGNESTVYADLRFPDAPSEILPTENKRLDVEETDLKTKNKLSSN